MRRRSRSAGEADDILYRSSCCCHMLYTIMFCNFMVRPESPGAKLCLGIHWVSEVWVVGARKMIRLVVLLCSPHRSLSPIQQGF